MTLIVGVEHAGAVYMGGDTGMWDQFTAPFRGTKLVSLPGLVLGVAGAFKGNNLLAHALEVPAREADTGAERWLVRQVVPAMRTVFADGGMWTSDNDGGGVPGLLILAAVEGELFEIGGDLSVTRSARGYGAVGHASAVGVALGVLHATRGAADPCERIRMALEAGEEHTSSVRAPYTFHGPA